MIQTLRKSTRRWFAFLMAIIMLMCSIQIPTFANTKYSNYLDGWTVQMTWGDFSSDYVWNAVGDEQRQPKITVTYRLENAEKDYPKGSLHILVPGIGNINRATLLKASQIAADKDDSEWDYTWDESTDTYFFTNKFDVKKDESVSGGFELLWTLNVRDCMNDFKQSKSPVFSINTEEGNGSIVLEPLSFRFSSTKDSYRIAMTREKLTGAEYDTSDKDYIWYTIRTSFDKDWNSRGLYKADYFVSVEIPDGQSYEDVKVEYGEKTVILGERNGEHGFFPFRDRRGDIGNQYGVYTLDFKLGFKRETLKEDQVTIKGHLDRLYHDEADWVKTSMDGSRYDIPDTELSFSVDDYGFVHRGYIYNHEKWNTSYEQYPSNHDAPLDYGKRLNATDLYNGKVIQFRLYGSANRNYEIGRMRTRSIVSPATPSNASAHEKEPAIPEGILDWNDINWKEHGLTETSETIIPGFRYGERYRDFLQATPSDAESKNMDRFFVPDIDIFGSLTKLYDRTSSLFSMTSYAANMTATPSESEKDSFVRETSANQMATNLNEKISSNSQIGENQKYSMIMGDDKLAIFLNNGKIRNLQDEEYDIVYVTVPSDSKKYDYEIWGAFSNQTNPDQNGQDTPFEDYVLLGKGNTEKPETFVFQEDVKATFIQIKDISGSYNCSAYVGVRTHLDWSAEQEKDFSERPDSENRLVNFSFFRAMSRLEDEDEWNDCAATADHYQGTYGQVLAERDFNLYGEYLFRSYSHVWLRNTVTNIVTKSEIESFSGGGETGFSTTLSSHGSIHAENTGSVKKFSMYMSIPKGLQPDIDEKPAEIFVSGTDLNGNPVNSHSEYATVSLKNISDKTFLVVDFDYSSYPMDIKEKIDIDIQLAVTLNYVDYLTYGNLYSIYNYLVMHDDGIDKISGSAIINDAYDLDEDGDTDEKMAYSGAGKIVQDNVNEWRQYVSKYVKSAYSAGYVTDTVTKFYDKKDIEAEKKKSDYSYRLDFALGSDNAKNIIFFDRIEQGARIADNADNPDAYTDIESEWQGQFISVDTSQMERLKIIPTIYYSTNPNQELDLSASGWSTEIPQNPGDVKTIAVFANTSQMEGSMMRAGQMAYVEIHMRAPEDTSLIGKRAVNQYYVQYDAYSFTDEIMETATLPSSETYVGLMDTVGKIILQKVDADNVTRTDEDGTKHYAPLSGAKFQVYDGPGKDAKTLFDSPKELNAAGRIVLKTMPYGTYFWEEVEAPAGYQRIEGRHPFEIDGLTELVNIENKRIPGSVTLTKQDADNVSYGPLSGATYELFRSDGVQVFTDKDYQYSDSGSNSEFVTTADGTFTVINLPWGNYYFLEKEAPNGYELSNKKCEFTIGREQYDAVTNTVSANVDAYNDEKKTDLLLIKTDSVSGKPIKNVMYSLFRETENGSELMMSELKTNAAGELLVSELSFGSYYFVETRNAGGYQMPDEAAARTETVTLDETTSGTEIKVFHSNDRLDGSVQLLKSDDSNQLVGGAEYTLYYKADTSKEDAYEVQGVYVTHNDRSSDNYGTILVSGLKWGSYYFVETKAPQGYEVSNEHVEFEVNADTVQNTIFLETMDFRKTGSVKLVKVDKQHPDIFLPNAVYELYRTDGSLCKAGVDYTLQGGMERITTGADGSVVISGIRQGGYYFKETKAPEGYSLSPEFIRFSVTKENADIVQELIAKDEAGKAVLTINKEVNEVHDTFGTPTFLFEIKRDDGRKSIQSITFENGHLTGSVSFTVDQAHTYTIRELEISRYILTEIVAVENVSVDGSGTYAIADLKTVNNAEVTFRNQISQYEKFSHVVNTTNIIKKDSYLTGIRVDYTGPNPLKISDSLPGYDVVANVYTIPKDDLIVKAFYDDGTEKTLKASEYTLIDPIIDCSTNNESFIGTVSYMDQGISKTGKFQISLDYTEKIEHYQVTFKLNGGTIIPDGASSAQDKLVLYVKDGQSVLKPQNDPIKEDAVFEGWYLNSRLTNKASFPFTATENITLYAKYIEPMATFRKGSNINLQLKALAGIQNPELETECPSITAIKRFNGTPDISKMTDMNVVSISWSEVPIYMWVEGSTAYWWSSDKNPTGYNDMGYVFCGFTELRDIDSLADWDMSYTEYIAALFRNCKSLEDISALSNWDLEHLIGFSGTFYGCESLENLDAISGWDVQYVTTFSWLLHGCSSLKNLNALKDWVVISAGDMDGMFKGCSSLTDISALSNWKNYTGNVRHMYQAFAACSSLTNLNGLSDWDIHSLSDIGGIFAGCSSLEDITALSTWNTENIISMYSVFMECTKLKDISPLEKWVSSKAIDIGFMFYGCTALENINVLASWKVDSAKMLRFMFYGCTSITDLSALTNWNTGSALEMQYMFFRCDSITNLNALSGWDVHSANDMECMFAGCMNVNDASPINDWEIGNVTNFGGIFYSCPSYPEFTKRSGIWEYGTFIPSS